MRDNPFDAAWEFAAPFTLTDRRRGRALWDSFASAADGDFVECGVWKGGSAILAALAMKHFGSNGRIWLYDTFSGMTGAGPEDTSVDGQIGETFQEEQPLAVSSDEVYENVSRYLGPKQQGRLLMIAGDVCKTLEVIVPERIKVLHLDTDFYLSTKAELEFLWPKVTRGGTMIVDDYGYWRGSKKAVDEWFTSPLNQFGGVIEFIGNEAVRIVKP